MVPWQYLPNPWRQALMDLPSDLSATLEEIRFRVGRSVHLYGADWQMPLSHPDLVNPVSLTDLERVLEVLVDRSLYARTEELRHGYITLPGGHRVGIAARAVVENGRIVTVRQVTGLNMRVARAIQGAGETLLALLEGRDVTHGSWLLVSPPRGGKTTLLRDVVRILSDRGRRVVVVDERSEIAGFGGAGVFGHDLGLHTDVLDGWPKPEGIDVALRTLGPDLIAVDELGEDEDLEAVRRARYSGVDVLATVHARSLDELRARTSYRLLLASGGFEAAVVLASQPTPGTVVQVWTSRDAS